jgi:hypothetical protein
MAFAFPVDGASALLPCRPVSSQEKSMLSFLIPLGQEAEEEEEETFAVYCVLCDRSAAENRQPSL